MATGLRWLSSRVARLFPWLGRRRAEREIRRELDLHLELEMQEQRKLGMSRSDAARAARVNLGNVSLIREDARAVWGWHWADVLSQDARRALRSLFREPELNAVVMLALAIGLTTATFTVADGLLFRPVPFDGADRLARVSMRGNTGGRITVSPAVFQAWRESPVFESVESATTGTALIDTATGPDAVGRSFTGQETQYGVVGVALETHYPSIDPSVNLPEFYQPLDALHARTRVSNVMVSLRCDPACPDSALIRQRVAASAPSIEVFETGSLDAAYLEQLAGPRAAAALGFVFACVAIVAAAGGLFAILSQAVGARRRELAIRIAVGASRVQIRRLVLRDAVLLGGVSLPLGAAGGWVLARGLASLQYGVTIADPAGWLVVIAVFATTTLLAAWIPAHRATAVEPVSALKSE